MEPVAGSPGYWRRRNALFLYGALAAIPLSLATMMMPAPAGSIIANVAYYAAVVLLILYFVRGRRSGPPEALPPRRRLALPSRRNLAITFALVALAAFAEYWFLSSEEGGSAWTFLTPLILFAAVEFFAPAKRTAALASFLAVAGWIGYVAVSVLSEPCSHECDGIFAVFLFTAMGIFALSGFAVGWGGSSLVRRLRRARPAGG